MQIIIFTGGEFQESILTKEAVKNADLIIAADAGANHAVGIGVSPSVVIGDLDSIDTQTKTFLENEKCVFVTSHPEKDETDTELAIDYAIAKGARHITLLGGLSGNRFDHVIATLLNGVIHDVPITFIYRNQRIWIEKGPAVSKIMGKANDLLSLIPLTSEVTEIVTRNLVYPLKNESLILGKSRGVSNILSKNNASVRFSEGILLLIHTVNPL